MRVMMVSSPDWDDDKLVEASILTIQHTVRMTRTKPITLVCSEGTSIYKTARHAALEIGWMVESHIPNATESLAKPRLNARMLGTGVDFLVVFQTHETFETKHVVETAQKMGTQIKVHTINARV